MSMPTTTSTPSTTGECPWSWPAAGLLPKAGSTRRALGERCRRSSHQGRKSLSHQKRQALALDVAHDNDCSTVHTLERGGSFAASASGRPHMAPCLGGSFRAESSSASLAVAATLGA